jgi:hypothetical protein
VAELESGKRASVATRTAGSPERPAAEGVGESSDGVVIQI